MGLDITAYRQLTKVENPEMEDGQPKYYDTEVRLTDYAEKHWPGRGTGLVLPAVYTWKEKIDFGRGSYGLYNSWRAALCWRIYGYGPQRIWDADHFGGPLAELINFSDCEGVIGPVVSAKLAKEFAEYEKRIGDLLHYAEWRKAFEMAADGGAVDFH